MFKFAIQKGHCGKTKSQIQTDCSGSNVDFERISDKYIHEALLKDTTDLRQAVIKISNISWDLTTTEVIEWLTGKAEKQSSNSRPVFKLKPSNDILVTGQIINISKRHIHIPIDRSTGKTKADMYVELLGPQDALYCIKKYNKGILKGRSVTISMSSMEELHEVHFYSINAMKCIDTDQVLSFSGTEAILNICRNYKAHFSRKCAERPFEHVISLFRLAPWYCLDEAACERLFYLALGTMEALVEHLKKIKLLQRRWEGLNTGNQIYDTTTWPSSIRGSAFCGFSSFFSPSSKKLATNEQLYFGESYPYSIGAPGFTFPPPSSLLGDDLVDRLLHVCITFPAFSKEQKMAIEQSSRGVCISDVDGRYNKKIEDRLMAHTLDEGNVDYDNDNNRNPRTSIMTVAHENDVDIFQGSGVSATTGTESGSGLAMSDDKTMKMMIQQGSPIESTKTGPNQSSCEESHKSTVHMRRPSLDQILDVWQRNNYSLNTPSMVDHLETDKVQSSIQIHHLPNSSINQHCRTLSASQLEVSTHLLRDAFAQIMLSRDASPPPNRSCDDTKYHSKIATMTET